MPIQQMLLGVGAVATKTYVDDIFNTYVYTGNSSARSINTGIDMTKDGLVWIKNRDQGYNHSLQDTVRGAGKDKRLASNLNSAQDGTDLDNYWAGYISSFNNNGFSVDKEGSGAIDWANYNKSGDDYTSWTFRKAPGFFTIKEYSGTGSSQSVSHDLGSQPGMIFIKRTDASGDWMVYHRDLGTEPELGQQKYLVLNGTNAAYGDGAKFSAAPTATTFSVGTSSDVNASGGTYIAYILAGGESTNALARSVDFDGTDDYLSLASSADFNMGTGDYTIECWFNPDGQTAEAVWTLGDFTNGQELFYRNDGSIGIYQGEGYLILSPTNTIEPGQWYHSAVVRHSGTLKLYINGTLIGSASQSGNLPTNGNGPFYIGVEYGGGSFGNYWPGKISNLRVVKGTAVYTSSFKPPTEPLTNITNTKLLCCNNSSTTGSTVTPGTITAVSSPTASTDSPFDDPAGFKFGEAGDQNVIKCGSYVGSGSAGIEVNIGFEPQLILVKSTASGENWEIYDSTRGIVDGLNQSDRRLRPNTSDSEDDNPGFFSLRPNGFIVNGTSGSVNQNGVTFVFLAIRRPDGYVGKPPELGTGVFAMDTGNESSTIPAFDSGFVVDMRIAKAYNDSSNWWLADRLRGRKHLFIQSTNAESTASFPKFDSNVGEGVSWSSDYQGWMWKRHAGFDVVTYTAKGGSLASYAHSLGKIPEMLWVKRRDSTNPWSVYHKGLNGGSSPEGYGIQLNTNAAEASSTTRWASTAPTSTHFFAGGNTGTNNADSDYIAMLFASVDGISKVGYYSGSNSSQTISTGFAPRFLIMKKVDTVQGWVVLDTVRGWGSGDDERLEFHNTNAQNDSTDFGAPTSSGFTLVGNVEKSNQSGGSYIYYAHA